jgi:hypothetical protein
MMAPDGEKQAERAANAGEQQAFGQQLAKNAQATGAERGANREFAGTDHGAGEQQISHVGASDEQQEADGCKKNDKQRLHVADDVFFQRQNGDAFVLVGFRIFLREMLRDRIHIGLSLRERNTGLEASDDVSAEIDVAIAERNVRPLAAKRVDVATLTVEGEVWRHDADDGVVRAVESDGFSGDVEGGAKFAAPEAAAEHDHGSGAKLIVTVVEGAPDDGTDAEDFEEFGGDHVAGDAFGGFAGAKEVVVLVAVHGERGEGLIVALPVEEIGVVGGSALDAGHSVVHGDELAGLGIGQRIEEDAVDHGEKRGVGANAESKSENGDSGEERGLEEHAEGVAQILHRCGHSSTSQRPGALAQNRELITKLAD